MTNPPTPHDIRFSLSTLFLYHFCPLSLSIAIVIHNPAGPGGGNSSTPPSSAGLGGVGAGGAVPAGGAGTAVPAAGPKKPTALSRWKKLTGTAMFINRLGKDADWHKRE